MGGLSAYAGKVNFVQPKEGKGLTITLAQGNIEQNLEMGSRISFMPRQRIYQKQILAHLGKSDLIILPESALPTL